MSLALLLHSEEQRDIPSQIGINMPDIQGICAVAEELVLLFAKKGYDARLEIWWFRDDQGCLSRLTPKKVR